MLSSSNIIVGVSLGFAAVAGVVQIDFGRKLVNIVAPSTGASA